MIRPILFNTEMVRAIIEGKKSCTRRLPSKNIEDRYFRYKEWADSVYKPGFEQLSERAFYTQYPPYHPGDILYVRETWCMYGDLNDADQVIDGTEKYYYRADGENPTPYNYFLVQRHGYDEHRDFPVWRPSIHMPKEAARIWLKVTEVRVERLQEITEDETFEEGLDFTPPCLRLTGENYCDIDGPCISKIKYCDISAGELFGEVIWNETIKKSDLDRYGWDANPWVWVIKFERCEKPEED